MSNSDPMDHLHDAWRQMDTPPVTRKLNEEDATTQEVVNWMEQAWQQVEVPVVELPRRGSLISFRKWALAGAAAVAAALLISVINFLNPQSGILTDGNSINIAVDRPTVPEDLQVDDPIADVSQLTTSKLIANTPEKVEILSGRVRLTMLRGQSTSTEPNT